MNYETTKTNMLTDLEKLFQLMDDEKFLTVYNELTCYDYEVEDIDWEQ